MDDRETKNGMPKINPPAEKAWKRLKIDQLMKLSDFVKIKKSWIINDKPTLEEFTKLAEIAIKADYIPLRSIYRCLKHNKILNVNWFVKPKLPSEPLPNITTDANFDSKLEIINDKIEEINNSCKEIINNNDKLNAHELNINQINIDLDSIKDMQASVLTEIKNLKENLEYILNEL
jgi:hypothetical protein